MKIRQIRLKSIKLEYGQIIDNLIKNKMFTSYRLEHSYLTFTLYDDDKTNAPDFTITELLRRKLCEDSYLRRTDTPIPICKCGERFSMDTGVIEFHASITECIDYIMRATPPRLKDQIQTIRTLHDIRDIMSVFLIEESPQHSFYIDLFKKTLHFSPMEEWIESSWIPNEGKIKLLQKINQDETHCCLIDTATMSPKDLIDKNENDERYTICPIQFTICVSTSMNCKYILMDIFQMIYDSHVKICDMKQSKTCIYLSCYTDTPFDGSLMKYIRHSYENII